jgi:hypothetical protein
LAIRVGLYTMQGHHAAAANSSMGGGASQPGGDVSLPLLDLFCYTGYKYLGLCVNMLVSLLLGHVLGWGGGAKKYYYVSFVYTATAASFFMLKTMANNIPTVTASTGPKREIMVLAFAASQFASMWWLSQTKYL